jgi:hypothetical protein
MYAGDFDVGEQFPNFRLHEGVQPFCGVEIPDDLLRELEGESSLLDWFSFGRLMRWGRLPFG